MATNPALSIPIVDLLPFTSSNPDLAARRRAADDLHQKLRINGCIGFSHHGVSPALLAEAFTISKSLFDLPYASKMLAPHPNGPTPHRSYSGTGKEKGAAKTALETTRENNGREDNLAALKQEIDAASSDYKESYEIGSEENKVQYNIWLPEEILPGFREFMTGFYWEVGKAVDIILDALLLSLELDPQSEEAKRVKALHTGHDHQLRLLRYPTVSSEMLREQEGMSRLGAHRDWSTFTLLFQDQNSGLEFGDLETDSFIPAIPKDGVVYCNIGDMFSRISNNHYPSALHRVIISGKADGQSTPARYSIPYFVGPQPDGVIEPLPSLVQRDGKSCFEPVTFASYSEQMFNTTNVYDE